MFFEVLESLAVLVQKPGLPLVYLFLESSDLRAAFVPQKPNCTDERSDDHGDDFDEQWVHIYLRTRPYTMTASTREVKDIAKVTAPTM